MARVVLGRGGGVTRQQRSGEQVSLQVLIPRQGPEVGGFRGLLASRGDSPRRSDTGQKNRREEGLRERKGQKPASSGRNLQQRADSQMWETGQG